MRFYSIYENGTSGEYLAPSKCAETRAFQPTIELVVLLFARVSTLGWKELRPKIVSSVDLNEKG